jgi:hypothetical protein
MLALWVWGVVLWVEGLDRGSVLCLTGAGVLVALAELAKYYAIALIPLLAMYALMKTRRIGKWSLALLIPILTLGIYHAATQRLYGKTLLSDAAAYAAIAPGFRAVISAKSGGLLSALTFMGGCLAICAFSAPLLFRRRALAWILVGTAIFAALLFSSGLFLKDYGPLHGTTRWFVEIQLIFWAMGGACLLALPVADIWARRNASSWLFGLWVGGTFIFAALLNWTVNGRSILPMAPAVAILLARRLDECPRMPGNFRDWGAWFALVLGGALALLVTRADFLFATTVRESARQTFAKYAQGNNRFWFQGHWGFQYYMEQLGVAAVDEGRTPLKRGDIVAEPVNNTNYTPFRPELVKLREMLAVRGERPLWLATMKGEVGAGFYAAIRGPLPFAWGDVPEELVAICALEPEIKFPSTSP